MFTALEQLQSSGLLAADVWLSMKDGSQMRPQDLSAGEQQMLTITGMLRLQRGGESLFLLDEPDAHFHPEWSQRWYSSVRAMLDDGQRSQFIATTHDPALVSNIPREQIRILRRDESGRVTADVPDVDPRGLGIGGLITTELYGMSTQLDAHTQQLIDDQYELVSQSELDPVDRHKLARLNAELETLGIASARRDPVVSLFLAELARRRRELIDAANSDHPPTSDELMSMASILFDERFSRGL